MNFNLTNWKPWKKQSAKPNELSDYLCYQSAKHGARIVLFKSAASVVEHFEKNFEFTGGTGSWQHKCNTKQSRTDKDEWRFGSDFRNHNETAAALNDGRIAEQYLPLLEIAKERLYNKFPKLHEIKDTAMNKRRRRKYSEDGDELSIDRYMCGDPAMWESLPRQDVKQKTARVYIDLDISGGLSPETITSSLVEMVALLEIIQLAGISIEIIIGFSTERAVRDIKYTISACVAKEANEPMDTARFLSFAIPGFYRQFTFALWNNLTDSTPTGDAGSCVDTVNREMYDFFNADIKIKTTGVSMDDSKMEVFMNGINKLFNLEVEAAN